MFNTKKICECGFSVVYDRDRDIKGFSKYIYCPICKSRLKTIGYSPNI